MNDASNAEPIFAPLWRRKWLILAVAILAAAGTYLYYRRATPTFQATTEIFLGAGAEELPGGERKSAAPSAATQLAIINSIVIEKVRAGLRKEHNLAAAHGIVRAKAAEKGGQFIIITTEAHRARAAATLANAVAVAYIRRQRETHRRVINTRIEIARRQLRRIELSSASAAKPGGKGKGGAQSSASVLQTASISGKINALEAQLEARGAQQVKPAKPLATQQVAPKPRKNAEFGFVVGLLLASIAAYALSRLDRRLRSLEGVESVLPGPILTALPAARRPIVQRDGQAAPSRVLLEPLRRLQTTLRLSEPVAAGENGRPRPRSILFVSPDAGDGKSTLIANLAMVQRDAGDRVAVVEANLRRPVLGSLLDAVGTSGLTDVLIGAHTVEDAMKPVGTGGPVGPRHPEDGGAGVATVVESHRLGSLELLGSGPETSNPPALLGSAAMGELLRTLAGDHDSVLVDAPSPLEFSDAMPLMPAVDGIILVARIGYTREASARKLVELLSQVSCAPVLGTVVNCASQRDLERYGFSARAATLGRRRS
jgi:Mrp family chromosome partitioning ATPase/capsular polysaccharide biosynthesis protein